MTAAPSVGASGEVCSSARTQETLFSAADQALRSVSERVLHKRLLPGDDPGNEILLRRDQRAQQQRQDDAVREGPGKNNSLLARHSGHRNARRDVLGSGMSRI